MYKTASEIADTVLAKLAEEGAGPQRGIRLYGHGPEQERRGLARLNYTGEGPTPRSEHAVRGPGDAESPEEESSPLSFDAAAALYERLLSKERSLKDRLLAEGKKMHGTKVAPGITSVQTLADRGSDMWGDLKSGLEVARGRGPEDLGLGGVIYPEEQTKVSGYDQNVVGFDDIEEFKRRRAAILEAEKTHSPQWDDMMRYVKERSSADAEGRRPSYRELSEQYNQENPESVFALQDNFGSHIGGEELGTLGRNTVSGMQGNQGLDNWSGSSTGEGYLPREAFLKQWSQDPSNAPQETQDAINASKHKYYTSTRAS